MSAGTSLPPIDEIVENFEFLDDWHDRFEYLLDLGKLLTPLPDEERVEANRVHGCQATVWLVLDTVRREGLSSVEVRAVSDAHMVNGLIAIVTAFYRERRLDEVAALDPLSTFRKLGLEDHLSPTRRNGLHAMVQRIQALARAENETHR